MATRAEIEAIIKLKDELTAKLKVIGKEFDNIGGKSGNTKTKLDSLSSSMGKGALQAVGLGAAIGGAAGAVTLIAGAVRDGVKSFIAFESSMVRLETLVGLSRGEVEAFTDDIKRLSLETGRPQIELAEAMFQITSAGLRGADALDALNASAKGAAVGLGDALTIADVATSVVNAYGQENINASKAVDVLLKAVREGKTDPRELASSLSTVIPIAAEMGITFEEVSGLIAKLTKSGTGASEAATQMRGAMLSMLSPSEQARKILEDVGLSMDDVTAALNEGGLLGALQFLREHMSIDQLSKFIGRMEALGGVLSVTGEHFEDTTRIIESTTDALGAMDEAMARVEETAALRAAKVSAAWENVKKGVGGVFAGLAVEGSDAFDKIAERAIAAGSAISAFIDQIDFALGNESFGGVSILERLGLSDEQLTASLPDVSAVAAGVAAGVSQVEQEARKMVEAELAAAAAIKPTTDELEKQKKAVEQHAEKLRKLADSLGTRGLAMEAKNAAAALKTLNAEGETLSKAGLKNVTDLVDELVENSLPVPDLLADIAIRFGEINNIAAQTFPNLRAVNVEFLEMSQSIPIAGKAAKEMAANMKAFGPTLKDFSADGGGQVSSAADRAADATESWRQQQELTNSILQAGTDIMRLYGIEANSTAGQILALGSSLAASIPAMTDFNKSILGSDASGAEKGAAGAAAISHGISAISSATSSGGAGSSALKGAGAGASTGAQIGGPYGAAIGAAVGAAIGFFRGRARTRAIKDISREVGSTIDEAMLQVIRDSGKHSQTFIAEIFGKAFSEGTGDVNRFAEEIGDLFSFLERDEISKSDVITELKESIPLLIEHFGELGETGQMEVARIIDAAKLAGISIDELGALILMTLDDKEVLAIVDQLGVTKAAAEALGVTFDQLSDRVQSIFAPETLETLAENFGQTTEEMRAILGDLGIAVQTDLERLAAAAGLTVEDFRALGEALQSATGIPAEQLAEFMKQTGQTADELASALGVDVSASIGTINDEAAQTALELATGANESTRMADELERAARAASSISVGIGGFNMNIPAPPDVSAAGGFSSPRLPDDMLIQAHKGEQVSIGKPGESGMSVSLSIGNITVGSGGGNPKEVARQIAEELAVALERGTSPLRRPIQRIADGSA